MVRYGDCQCRCWSLTYDEVKKIKRMLEEGEHVLKIAEEFNISRKVVSKIKSGRSYAWVEH